MTTTNGIDGSYYYENRPKEQSNSGILGKDDFLRILIAQLQYQDPLNPMDDREFIAQMAQFSSLEQMTNMNSAIQQFVKQQTSQTLVQHSELIGKRVTWKRIIDIDEYRQKEELVENTVTSVRLETNGNVSIQLDSGRWISADQLVQVSGKTNHQEEAEGDVGDNAPDEQEG
ncbi:flagellar hook assembly protein FlgD [Halalkalibacterium halodurans]|uniref:Flagellar hook assembly protein n=2 Tax=Halalkalibacterium halodurans TaxID=86665 RepID=Q9KA39_HALH5|nr:flagellar hook assembly protein FlgD [Halalkalibacterium halodurans]MED4081552.1 flagellar hook assembly protein FlgD [Halalkalibacterium halodurans]MED4086168.1 flagellar hook assembly protein FlgD [Halalkalibacterium halodurans]MED4106190.1 flagellar hook assembly protein FlgD [Halalkalibacterium halodurans]MED4108603.1 flagellar hook assembly protein FlgD [Halalkalibacterium halodurans]MED4124445.1 flagellar hook assembly protein FlgD [Halalkalibacterium halodurans]